MIWVKYLLTAASNVTGWYMHNKYSFVRCGYCSDMGPGNVYKVHRQDKLLVIFEINTEA